MDNNKKVFILIICLLILGVIVAVLFGRDSTPPGPGQYDTFAQCLTEKKVVFYGAFWCSHCQSQKKLFGSSIKFVDYVECSTPDGRGQLQICKDRKIESYPTWEFADGSRLTGEISLQQLADKTSCLLASTVQ